MNYNKQVRVGHGRRTNFLLTMAIVAIAFGCHKPNPDSSDLRNFKQVNLVANTSEYHPVTTDNTLINGFGMAWSPNGIAWVNSVGGHVSELYNGEGGIARNPVNIPSPTAITGGLPTGIVFSGGKGFKLPNGTASFLFTGFDGVLSGWNGALGDNAIRLKNPPGASYTGLAIASNGGRNLIYAANFGAGKIDVWDTAFARIPMPFIDPAIPPGFSPYNIQAIGEKLYVIYGELGANGLGVPGSGKGFVSIFNTDGSFVKRFASRGSLNLPWGVTMAPGSFLSDQDLNRDGKDFSGEATPKDYGAGGGGSQWYHDPKDPVVLVGNFGDGRINVYSQDGRYLGQLKSHSRTIVIDGLWALSFAPATATVIDPDRLYFTAGPEHETEGLFGYLIKQ